MQFFVLTMQKITDELRFVLTNYSEKVLATMEQQQKSGATYLLKTDPDDHTPYTSIGHRDLWIMNVMFKNGNSGNALSFDDIILLDHFI